MPLHPIDQFLVPLYSDILSFPYLLLTLTIIPAVLSAVIIIFSKRYDYRNFLRGLRLTYFSRHAFAPSCLASFRNPALSGFF